MTPSLTLDAYDTTVAAGGTQVVTVSDSRGAAAAGKVVNARWPGVLKASANKITLDANGDGTVTFGPEAAGYCTSMPIKVVFGYDMEPVNRVTLTLQFEG